MRALLLRLRGLFLFTIVVLAVSLATFAYDGQSTFAAENTAVQMTGKYAWDSKVYMSFQTSKGAVGVSGELVPNGSQLLLKDVAIYPEGADKLNIGFSQVAQIRDAVAAEAQAQGYTSLRITGQRFSGANYGKPIDITIQLGNH